MTLVMVLVAGPTLTEVLRNPWIALSERLSPGYKSPDPPITALLWGAQIIQRRFRVYPEPKTAHTQPYI